MKKRFLFLLCFAVIFISCSDDKVKPRIDKNIRVEELPAQESWNSTVIFSDSGKTKAVLETGHLRVFTEGEYTLLDSGVKVNFYNEFGKVSTVLTSKRGKVDDVLQNLYAIDSVEAVNDSGVKINTDQLMWRNKDRKIVSDKFVTITRPKEKIEGYGFESDQSLINYVIYDITYITRTDTSAGKR